MTCQSLTHSVGFADLGGVGWGREGSTTGGGRRVGAGFGEGDLDLGCTGG